MYFMCTCVSHTQIQTPCVHIMYTHAKTIELMGVKKYKNKVELWANTIYIHTHTQYTYIHMHTCT